MNRSAPVQSREEHDLPPTMTTEAEIRSILEGAGLIASGDPLAIAPLTGGVSSELWRIETPAGTMCVKRALPRLRVAQVWEVPLDRNHFEAEWMRVVRTIAPTAVPKLLAEVPERGAFVMEFLDPARFPLWKPLLQAGTVSLDFAASVGATLARIHGATAHNPDIARRFATDGNFHAIRLEPYLEATARVHADLHDPLMRLSHDTAATRICLVHGDISPKNILVGADGPVFLDAECAWYGDPAFDLAFVLNHLLLKCLWTPGAADRFLAAFAVLREAYLSSATWEEADTLEGRIARLLPGLLLARVDGKSPVEYVESAQDKDKVRRVARRFLLQPSDHLGAIAEAWCMELRT